MPRSLAQVYRHLAWSTRNSVPFLKDEALRTEMHSYIAWVRLFLIRPDRRCFQADDW